MIVIEAGLAERAFPTPVVGAHVFLVAAVAAAVLVDLAALIGPATLVSVLVDLIGERVASGCSGVRGGGLHVNVMVTGSLRHDVIATSW